MNAGSKEAPVSVLGLAFSCSAPIPVIAIFLGFAVTPAENYAEMFGFLSPIAVYGYTGIMAAAVSFLSAILLFFPERMSFLTFRLRLVTVLIVCVFSCTAGVYVGFRIMSGFHHPIY
jgi:hypothetical protein